MALGLAWNLFILSTTISVISAVQAKKKAAAAREASLGQDVRSTNSAEPLDIHYGRTGTTGVRTLVATTHNHKAVKFNGTRVGSSVQDKTNGKKNEFLATEVAIGIGEITEIETVWTDDQKSTDSKISSWSTSYWNPPGVSNATSQMALADGRNGAVYYGGQIKASSTFNGLTHAVNIYKLDRDEPQFSGAPTPLYFIKKGVKVRTITPPGAAATDTAAAGHATRYTITRNLADTEDLLTYNNTVAYVLMDYLTNDIYGLNWKLYTEAEKAADANLIDDVDLEAFYKAYLICNEVVQGTGSVLFQQSTADLDGDLPVETPLEVEYDSEYGLAEDGSGSITYRGASIALDWPYMSLTGSGLTSYSYELNGWLDGLGQPTGVSSTEGILRYEYNGSISTGANHRANVSSIIGVIPGVEFFRSPTGQWKLVVPDSMTAIDTPDTFVAGTDYIKFNKVVFTPTTGLNAGVPSVYELLVDTSQDSPDTTRTNWARVGTALEPALYDSGVTYSLNDVVKYTVDDNASAFVGTTGLYVYTNATPSSTNPDSTSHWRRVAYEPFKIQKVGVINESELTADLSISYPDATDKYNQLDVRFPNVNKQYADDTITFPPEGSGIHKQFLAQDNEKDLKDLYDIRGLIDAFHAKAWASNKVRQSRREMYEFETRPSGFLYEPGDILKLEDSAAQFGNNNIYVKVLTTKVKPDLSVKFNAIRFYPSDYGWEIAGLPTIENRVPIEVSDEVPAFPALNASGFPDSNFDLTDTGSSRVIPLSWTIDEDTDIAIYQVVIETQKRATPDAQGWTTLATLPSSITSFTHVIGDSAGIHWYRIYGVTTDQRKVGPVNTIATYGKAQVNERSAVITTNMTATNGTAFKDGVGSTVLQMNVYLDGVLSVSHSDYTYSWQVNNASGDAKVVVVSSSLSSGNPELLNDTASTGPLLAIGDPSTDTGREDLTVPSGYTGIPADSLNTLAIANSTVSNELRRLTVGAEDVHNFEHFTCIVGNLPD